MSGPLHYLCDGSVAFSQAILACSLSGLAEDQQNIWKVKNRLQASVLPCVHLMNSFAENKYAQIV
jgi:hypothetical protein